MYYRAISLAVEAMIAVGALVLALLASALALRVGPAVLARLAGLGPPAVAWPEPLAFAVRALVWPLTRPFGRSSAEAEPATILLAMLIYLVLTVAAVGIVNLLLRRPPTQR